MMITKITKKITLQKFQHTSTLFLREQKNVNISSYAHNKNIRNFYSAHPLIKGIHIKTTDHSPRLMIISCQRYVSSEPIKQKSEILSTTLPVTDSFQSEQTEQFITNIINILSDTAVVNSVENFLVQMHNATGLPWWATIAFTTFFVRSSLTLPISIFQVHLLTKIQAVESNLIVYEKQLQKELNYIKANYGWPYHFIQEKNTIKLRKKKIELLNNENCHPIKTFYLVAIQFSLWSTLTLATRKLCLPPHADTSVDSVYTEMLTGGFGWITNLVEIDSYMILPITLTLVNIAIFEVHRLNTVKMLSENRNSKLVIFQLITLGLIPVSVLMPAGINIYWLSSSIFGLLQALILNLSFVQSWLKTVKNESVNQNNKQEKQICK